MAKNKKQRAHERLLRRAERIGPEEATRRRRARRDRELARLAKLRDEAKGPLREFLTKSLERRREALEQAEKRRADRKAKRAERRARWLANRNIDEPLAEEPAAVPSLLPDGFSELNAQPTIDVVEGLSVEALAEARTVEENRVDPRVTVLRAIEDRERELAAG